MPATETKFITLAEASQTVIGPSGPDYPPIRFLDDSKLYSDLLDGIQLSGSASTLNTTTMGECDLSHQVAALHNRKVRLSARARRQAQSISRFTDTNLHTCVNAGLLDLNNSERVGNDGAAWYTPLSTMSHANMDIIVKPKGLDPNETLDLLFERMIKYLDQTKATGIISLIDTGRIHYINYRSPHEIYTRHVNLLATGRDAWNTTRSSRSNQVVDLIKEADVLGFYPNPDFYQQAGRLNYRHDHLGGYLADAARELRTSVTNHPHRINFPSFIEKIPSKPTTSYEEEALFLGNLTIASLHKPDLTDEFIELLGLSQFIGKSNASLAEVRASLVAADHEYFRYPHKSIYPNVPHQTLSTLAPYFHRFLTMSLSGFLASAPLPGNRLKVLRSHLSQ